MRRSGIIACLVLLLANAMSRAGDPATQPPSSQPSVAALIDRLADPDPVRRDQATRTIWSLGRAAEPAIRAAANDPNPEIARRAKGILRDFMFGLYPDAPREIFNLLEQYRRGEGQEKRSAVLGLGSAGVPGIRVLLRLREDERDPNWKMLISQVLAPREHEVSVLMLAEGQNAEVEQMLERSAFDSPVAAQDYAALLLLDGKLNAPLAKMKSEPITARSAPVLVALARAAGDMNLARQAAEKSADPDLLDSILIDQGDWATLATRVASGAQRLQPPEKLGFLCAYYRLAGNEKNATAIAAQLVLQAANNPQDYLFCAENLFLNDRPDQAIGVLSRRNDFLQLTNFLAARLQFSDALDLPRQAEQGQSADALEIKARTVGTLLFLGETERAKKLTSQVLAENRVRNDFATWVSLVESFREAGMTSEADTFAAEALEKAAHDAPMAALFEKLRIGTDGSAVAWWQFFRQQNPGQPATMSLKRVHGLFDGTLSREEMDPLSEAARHYGTDLPAAERAGWEQSAADLFTAAGRDDLAVKWIEQLEGGGEPSLIHAGDWRAVHQDWAAAARDYDHAFQRDRTKADALFLRGWALSHAGDAHGGDALMDEARRLPLGSEDGRFALFEAMVRHDLKEEARKQLELILRVGSLKTWAHYEALRRSADDLAETGHDLLAAQRWTRAFLRNLTNDVYFNQPWANVIVPAMIRKARAMGLIKAGRIEEALAEARISLADAPGDADALIDMVNALDAAGDQPQADELYSAQTRQYRDLIKNYPNSGPLHNQLAWAQVMCHRELDEALANARRAVELEPTSTASRDTLAEVYFARHDPAAAAAQMQKCIELEPRVERHRTQLTRFRTAASQPSTKP